jgi:hypothetical protein
MTVAEKISKYKVDLEGVHEVRWAGVAPNQQAKIHFSMGREMRFMN